MSLLGTGNAKVAEQKANFVAGGPKVVTPPRRKAFKLDEVVDPKILFFGQIGSGKTFSLVALLLLGYKVLYITTDIGDGGHITVINELRRINRKDLIPNFLGVPLVGWKEVKEFFEKPLQSVPELKDFDFNAMFWDGYSGFQQVDISEYVGGITPAVASGGRELPEARLEGLQFENTDWGLVKNATIRSAEWYFSFKHPTDPNRKLIKIMTCHENLRTKTKSKPNEPTVYEDSYVPMLQGAGGQLLLGGFDLIARCKAKIKKGDDGEKRVFTYVLSGHENLVAKNRGFDLPAEMDADPVVLFNTVFRNLDHEPPVTLDKYPERA